MKWFLLPRVSRGRRFRIRAFVFASAVALAASAAPSHVASPAQIAVARRLFRQATILEILKKWDDAIVKLKQVIAIKETPGVRYHLAYCEEHAGHWVKALNDYNRAGELLREGAKAPDVEHLLGPARDALKKRMPKLTVDVPAGVLGATLSLDGKPLPPELAGQQTPLNPGPHTVRVTAPGHQAFSLAVTLQEGDARVVKAKLLPLPPPPTAPPAVTRSAAPPPVAEKSSALEPRTLTLIAEGAVTAAGLGVGIGYTLAASSASSRANAAAATIDRIAGSGSSACLHPVGQTQDACNTLSSALADRTHDRTIATVGFVGAGLGAAAGIVTWFVWRPKPKEQALSFEAVPLAGGGVYWTAHGTF